MARPAAGVAASNFLSSALYLQTVPSRRTLVCGAAGGCTVALAGCAEILRGSPNPDVGRPELRGSLVGDADTATVVVDVENSGPTGEIRVIAEVVSHDDTVLDSYERTTKSMAERPAPSRWRSRHARTRRRSPSGRARGERPPFPGACLPSACDYDSQDNPGAVPGRLIRSCRTLCIQTRPGTPDTLSLAVIYFARPYHSSTGSSGS